jgi:hypothetical protein
LSILTSRGSWVKLIAYIADSLLKLQKSPAMKEYATLHLLNKGPLEGKGWSISSWGFEAICYSSPSLPPASAIEKAWVN